MSPTVSPLKLIASEASEPKVTSPVAPRVVNAPSAGVTLPILLPSISVLSISPAFIVKSASTSPSATHEPAQATSLVELDVSALPVTSPTTLPVTSPTMPELAVTVLA